MSFEILSTDHWLKDGLTDKLRDLNWVND